MFDGFNDARAVTFAPVIDVRPRTPEIIAAEIRAEVASICDSYISIGTKLIEAKELVPHGEWENYVKEDCDFSMRHAQRCMSYARELKGLSKYATVAHLGTRPLDKLLALPVSDREAIAELADEENLTPEEFEDLLADTKSENEKLKEQNKQLQLEFHDMQINLSNYRLEVEQAQSKAKETIEAEVTRALLAKERELETQYENETQGKIDAYKEEVESLKSQMAALSQQKRDELPAGDANNIGTFDYKLFEHFLEYLEGSYDNVRDTIVDDPTSGPDPDDPDIDLRFKACLELCVFIGKLLDDARMLKNLFLRMGYAQDRKIGTN